MHTKTQSFRSARFHRSGEGFAVVLGVQSGC
jgi:hypothetical protein